MVREVFFIADDFGRDASTNEAIVRSHLEGALHGAVLMMGQAGTEEAIGLARQYPSLQIGWHWHVCDSQPVTIAAWPWGNSPIRAGLAIGFHPPFYHLAIQEMQEQWKMFVATELPCHFATTHHHLHVHPWLLPRFTSTVREKLIGWLRLGRPRYFSQAQVGYQKRWVDFWVERQRRSLRNQVLLSTTFWGIDRTFTMQVEEILTAMEYLGEGVHEFIFHPRQVGDGDYQALQQLRGRL